MLAVGGPDVLVTAELPDPTPQAGGVLVSLLNVNDATRVDVSSRDIRVERMSVVPDREGLLALFGLIGAQKLAGHMARTFPLDQAGAAHAFLATKPIGKVALTV